MSHWNKSAWVFRETQGHKRIRKRITVQCQIHYISSILFQAPLKFTSSHLVDGRLHRNREISEFCASSIISRLIKKDMQNAQSNAAKWFMGFKMEQIVCFERRQSRGNKRVQVFRKTRGDKRIGRNLVGDRKFFGRNRKSLFLEWQFRPKDIFSAEKPISAE